MKICGQVFLDPEAENIFERLDVDPDKFKQYTWIPHRPIIKIDEQSSPKIRPVFNCRGSPFFKPLCASMH